MSDEITSDRFNPFAVPNGNFTILGGAGEGKTKMMKKIIQAKAVKGAGVMLVHDFEKEYTNLIEHLGGVTVPYNEDGSFEMPEGEVLVGVYTKDPYTQRIDKLDAMEATKRVVENHEGFNCVIIDELSPALCKENSEKFNTFVMEMNSKGVQVGVTLRTNRTETVLTKDFGVLIPEENRIYLNLRNT